MKPKEAEVTEQTRWGLYGDAWPGNQNSCTVPDSDANSESLEFPMPISSPYGKNYSNTL